MKMKLHRENFGLAMYKDLLYAFFTDSLLPALGLVDGIGLHRPIPLR
jgi:hypothetical protein